MATQYVHIVRHHSYTTAMTLTVGASAREKVRVPLSLVTKSDILTTVECGEKAIIVQNLHRSPLTAFTAVQNAASIKSAAVAPTPIRTMGMTRSATRH